MTNYLPTAILIFALSLSAIGQTPTITTQFGYPENSCSTLEYCLDVEFKADMADVEIFAMNVRFFYDDNVLEFVDFRDFQGGYGPVAPNPPTVNTSESAGPELFNFEGPADFVNGAVQLINNGPPPIILETDSWTKIFTICFLVENPEQNLDTFCPAIVWDLEANPENGGFLSGDDGVVITVVDPDPNNESLPSIENVVQFNWEYIGDGSPPYGEPVDSICIDVNCALPVAWTSLSGKATPEGNRLHWQTINEEHIQGFEIEQSSESFLWNSIGYIPSEGKLFGSYEYLDSNPCCEKNYYRVAQVNEEGDKQYSGIITLGNALENKLSFIKAYPNPVLSEQQFIYLTPPPIQGTIVRLFNPIGQLIQEVISSNSGTKLDVSDLPAGIYLMAIDDGHAVRSLRIVIH